ncbi:hypothetical protein BV20DRAFT_798721 [Pilatotrama ljubarskyi]|nr:hypothetical protein BV20DRAFT_798721 [Pilatotrama ljubarskyi]
MIPGSSGLSYREFKPGGCEPYLHRLGMEIKARALGQCVGAFAAHLSPGSRAALFPLLLRPPLPHRPRTQLHHGVSPQSNDNGIYQLLLSGLYKIRWRSSTNQQRHSHACQESTRMAIYSTHEGRNDYYCGTSWLPGRFLAPSVLTSRSFRVLS